MAIIHSEIFDFYASNIIRGFDVISPRDVCLRLNKIKHSTLVNTCKNLFRNDNINLFIVGNITGKQKNSIIDLLDGWK